MEEGIEYLSRLCTTDIVHTRIEECTTSTEALQTAAYLRTLFENGHLVTILRQDTATGQAAQSTTYDHTLFHFSW